MKVICIQTDTKTVKGPQVPTNSVKEVEVYTVIGGERFNNKQYYRLAEMDYWTVYLSDLFVPLSQIDETEFERNYNKELV